MKPVDLRLETYVRNEDGTTSKISLDLLGPVFCLRPNGWTPAIMPFFETWVNSPYAEGRGLVDAVPDNTVDTFSLNVIGGDPDGAIQAQRTLHHLLLLVFSYKKRIVDHPVWIKLTGADQTNTGYAVIEGWLTPASASPFQPPLAVNGSGQVIIDGFTLSIEHKPWTENEPGAATCVPLAVTADYDGRTYGNAPGPVGPAFLEFNGLTSIVTVQDAASLQNLHDGAMTVEAVIRADGWGENNSSRIVMKGDNTFILGWQFMISQGAGLLADIECAVTDGRNEALSFSPDSEWYHVAVTWDDATYLRPRLWIAGVEPAYTGGSDRNGAIVADVGRDLYIGNVLNVDSTFDGGIAWVRVSNVVRYTGPFDAPDRCTLPAVDGNTVMLVIYEGAGATTFDLSGNENNGAIVAATWDVDCPISGDVDVGEADPTCDEIVRVNCQHVMANLTDVYWYDASGPVFGPNLMDAAMPIDFLPVVPAVGDIVYYIIDTAVADSGPFNNIVHNLSVAQVDLTIVWEYWNGAWVALTVQDNTDADGAMTGDPFDTVGDKSIHWFPPSDWTTTVINGITGWIVRARVTAIGAAPAPPTQAERLIYSVTWPYVDVDEDDVPGDISALARLLARQQGGQFTRSEFFFGLRRLARGANFSAYLNISDTQLPTGITTDVRPGTVWATLSTAPTGRAAVSGALATTIWNDRALIEFSPSLARQYFGVYQAFLRVVVTGTASEFSVRLRVEFGGQYYTDPVSPTSTSEYEILALGRVWIGDTLAMRSFDELEDSEIAIQSIKSGAAASITYYDLILIPVDEKVSHSIVVFGPDKYITHYDSLDVDSITVSRITKRVLVRNDVDEIFATWQSLDGGPFILEARTDQRLWALYWGFPSSNKLGAHDQQLTILLDRNARYMSMRGAG